MIDILNKIVEERKKAVAVAKRMVPVETLERMPLFDKECLSLKDSLLNRNSTGIIAEFKRASPSKGVINNEVSVAQVVRDYAEGGASGISILTEPQFFYGSNDDIMNQAALLQVPVLRKDFIVDEYQVIESKAIGADVILLIAAGLSVAQVNTLAALARSLGMEVLLELHDDDELHHICDETELIGVNNRNLKTFDVNIEKSLEMAMKIPSDKIRIAESGINSVDDIRLFRKSGFHGFLIGEYFMKEKDPGKAFKKFVNDLSL